MYTTSQIYSSMCIHEIYISIAFHTLSALVDVDGHDSTPGGAQVDPGGAQVASLKLESLQSYACLMRTATRLLSTGNWCDQVHT